jgi:hypothetical protein
MARSMMLPVTCTSSTCSTMESSAEWTFSRRRGSKAGGMGVSVDRGVVSQTVFPHDLAGVTPDEEVRFDFFAARVAADTALTSVAEKVWRGADFAVSDDLIDVHGGSSGARHICPTYVNGIITSCQLTKCGGGWVILRFGPTFGENSSRGGLMG